MLIVNMLITLLSWANQTVCLPCAASEPEKEEKRPGGSMAYSKIRKVDAGNRTSKDE